MKDFQTTFCVTTVGSSRLVNHGHGTGHHDFSERKVRTTAGPMVHVNMCACKNAKAP